MRLLLIVFAFFYCFGALSNDNIFSVAASEFKTNGCSEQMNWLGSSCADAIIDRLSSDKQVRVLERENISKIIEELKLQMTALVDEEHAVEIGRIIGADYFIFGTVSVMNEKVVISARVANVETTEIVSTSRISGDLDNLFTLQDDLARDLSKDLSLNSVLFSDDNLDVSKITFNVYSELNKLKELAHGLTFFHLDPARKRKKADYITGINIADELLEIHPKLYLAYYYKSLFSLNLENFRDAEKYAELASKLNSKDVQSNLLWAGSLMQNSKSEEAEEILNKLTGSNQKNSIAWYGLSVLYQKMGMDYKALECLINSLNGNSFIPKAYSNLQTLVTSTSLGNIDSYSGEDYYNCVNLLNEYWSNNSKKRKDLYTLAEKVNANFFGLFIPYFIMAQIKMESGDLQSSESLYKKSLKLCPFLPEIHREIAKVYYKTSRCKLAENHLNIYLNNASVVDDFEVFEKLKKKCN